MIKKLLILLSFLSLPLESHAYTSLVAVDLFDGPAADVNSIALGIIGIYVVLAALIMIMRGMFGGR